jgi:hypothetical protein
MLYELIPTMPEVRLLPLIERFTTMLDPNCQKSPSETGARRPNPRECRGFSHTGK